MESGTSGPSIATLSLENCKALFPFFKIRELKERNVERPDWWTDDPIAEVPEKFKYLVDDICFSEAIEGEGGSLKLFAAACNVLRHGATGRVAEALLRLVPANPPFPPEQIRRVVECAYNRTVEDAEFNTQHEMSYVDEFPTLAQPTELPKNSKFIRITVEELESLDLKIDWLVDDAFTADGALFIGGRQKTFKTGIALDLLISLASGKPFLGHFPVTKRKTSCIFTAEIGMARAKYLVQAIRVQKGIKPGDLHGIDIFDAIPSFQINPKTGQPVNMADRNWLRAYLKQYKPEVAVFDPLYFAMGSGTSAGALYEIGAILHGISQTCREHGALPIFIHHACKDKTKQFQPMELDDFFGSGIPEFARQWLLLSHSEPFRDGKANLFASIGGSSQGSRGIFTVTIDEGQPDDIMDRKWEVSVSDSEEGESRLNETEALECLRFHGRASVAELAIWLESDTKTAMRMVKKLVREGKAQLVDKKIQLAG